MLGDRVMQRHQVRRIVGGCKVEAERDYDWHHGIDQESWVSYSGSRPARESGAGGVDAASLLERYRQRETAAQRYVRHTATTAGP